LFAAFDPMWAQKLANGITRYMAGSFDLYDPAVAARDAIRALGYEDAFVVRFVDGERVRASRPEPELLAEERASVVGKDVLAPRPVGAALAQANGPAAGESPAIASNTGGGAGPLPTRREDIPTWDGVAGRVYSVQVGAFRGVPDAEAMASLGTLTREDAGSDGWLRLFSGRFATQSEAEAHRSELRGQGRNDAFIVVYINGRRIPLSQASVTSVASLPGAQNPGLPQSAPEVAVADAPSNEAVIEEAWCVELGVFNSTIPVRLANAILDAPLQWQIRSVRTDGLTRYRTAFVSEAQARNWLNAAQVQGFSNAQLVRE
jgi:cell division septation protein DedD